jgi:hypothetical protein
VSKTCQRCYQVVADPCRSDIETGECRRLAQRPSRGEAVTFNRGESFRAVIDGRLQRPEFNSRGAALAFVAGVAAGTRRAEDAQ